MFRLNHEAIFGEFGLPGGRLETEIFRAIQNYGLFVRDGNSGSAALIFEDYHAQKSNYCWNRVYPLSTVGGLFTGQNAAELNKLAEEVGANLADPTLAHFTEHFNGSESCIYKLWEKVANDLQQLEPFSS